MRRSDFVFKCIAAVFMVTIICYVGFSLIKSATSTISTATAIVVTAGDSVQTTGYAVRNEYVLSGGGSNVAAAVSDGQKVSKNQTVAVAYNGDSALERAGQIRTLQARIKQLTEFANSDSSSISSQTIHSLAYCVAHNEFDTLDSLKMSADSAIFGTGLDAAAVTESELAALRLQLLQLESTATGSKDLTAPESGIFSTVTDGFENVSLEDIEYKTPSDVSVLFDEPESFSAPLGKLVVGSTWYYAAEMSAEDANELIVGRTMTLKFSRTYNGTLKMTVYSVGPAENGRCIVIFAGNTDLANTMSIRNLTAEVIISENKGILVPKEAVHLDDDNDPFVFIITGGQVEKAYISVLSEYGESYIAKSSSSSGVLLREGAEIVTRGNGLYSGKVVKK